MTGERFSISWIAGRTPYIRCDGGRVGRTRCARRRQTTINPCLIRMAQSSAPSRPDVLAPKRSSVIVSADSC